MRDRVAQLMLKICHALNRLTGCGRHLYAPPGHFYSPIPSVDDVRGNLDRICSRVPDHIPGIDLRDRQQHALVERFAKYYPDLPFTDDPREGLRYHYDNPAYGYSDAIFYYCMMRECAPQRIIEVGSGYSSCLALDTSERHFGNRIAFTFIEPYPKLLYRLIRDEDKSGIEVMPTKLQDVDPALFKTLQANDILFIDSTHVSKVDSDVNYIFSIVLPDLAPGVYVHFHDVFYPFEYPRAWLLENRAWNELYMLRTFLQFNDTFEIVAFNSYLACRHPSLLEAHLPLCMKNTGGSIWLRKTK